MPVVIGAAGATMAAAMVPKLGIESEVPGYAADSLSDVHTWRSASLGRRQRAQIVLPARSHHELFASNSARGMPPSPSSSSASGPMSWRTAPPRPRAARLPEGFLRLTVQTLGGGEADMEVQGEESCVAVLHMLAEASAFNVGSGTAGCIGNRTLSSGLEGSRLLFKGVPLRPDVSLRDSGVIDGSVLRLLPPVRESRSGHVAAAQRGLLMTPGNKPWAPSSARGPKEPLTVEPYAPYSANLTCDKNSLLSHPPLPVPDRAGRRIVRPRG
eukprot:TRINITY_DN38375_c0_g1_i1.p1 TRINITY_DN38375_c0_g1~~TRINITY_DN38375_c0_g1_i1.p1  ORF type:complete len:270 (+),score=24.47 TRINITY_DN38375_c0_g1_i1:92-901(+)